MIRRRSERLRSNDALVFTSSFFEGQADPAKLFPLTTEDNYRVRLGPSLLEKNSGLGLFVVVSRIRKDSFVCKYIGPRFDSLLQAEQAFPNSAAVFDGTGLVARPPLGVVVATAASYGYYINDPLMPHLVNASIRYNIEMDVFEVWTTGNDIAYLEEVYIGYSADFWAGHRHLAHCNDALACGYEL